jgi:signal transduction histidine kinase
MLFGVVYINRTGLSLFVDAWESYYTVALVSILLVTIGIGLLLSHLLIRPFQILIEKAKQIASGAVVEKLAVGPTAPREAHDLAEALTAMLDTLDARMGYVKEFTQNVSHEFKTPLTSIRGSVEILQSDWRDMSDEERERFIGIIEADVQRMRRLVERLIELTRLETAKPKDGRCELRSCLEELLTSYRKAGHAIALVAGDEAVWVNMAKDMAETLFVNLLDNAVKHGQGKGVEMVLAPGPVVSVCDRGPGISRANLDRIFNRFFTTARDSGGTGLGLPMAKAIINAHGGELSVSSDDAGTAFEVRFQA